MVAQWTLDAEMLRALSAVRKVAKTYSPAFNATCLCGSGLIFANCCKSRLPGPEGLRERVRTLFAAGKIEAALEASRADVTQYTIWHKSHTEPAVSAGLKEVERLLLTDIRALSDCVETMFFCYRRSARSATFPAVLERLRANINDERWQRRLLYFQTLCAAGEDWNEADARREFRKLGSIEKETDVAILQLFLHLHSDDLSFSGRLEIVDRILRETKSVSDRLHYNSVKAMLYWAIGDREKAVSQLSEAVAAFRGATAGETLSEYQQYRLGMSLSFLGSLTGDQAMLNEAIRMFEDQLAQDGLLPRGRADLFCLVGDAHRLMQAWDAARQSYRQASDAKPAAILTIHEAECLVGMERFGEASELLETIPSKDLPNSERIDWAFCFAAAALGSGNKERLERAKSELKDLKIVHPIFRERGNNLLLDVSEGLVSGKVAASSKRSLAEMLRSVGSYVILKPSFMGIGVDLGKIFEDASGKGKTK